MTVLLAIDPGSSQSAFMLWSDGAPGGQSGIVANEALLAGLRRLTSVDLVVIEQIESYGMAVGREVFETVRWYGRYEEALDYRGIRVEYIGRKKVKSTLCGTTTAKDANVRLALIDRFGGSKAAAVGTKAAPGPLYGIRADVWAALAVAVAWEELHP